MDLIETQAKNRQTQNPKSQIWSKPSVISQQFIEERRSRGWKFPTKR